MQIVMHKHNRVIASHAPDVDRYPIARCLDVRDDILENLLRVVERAVVLIRSDVFPLLPVFCVVVTNYHNELQDKTDEGSRPLVLTVI